MNDNNEKLLTPKEKREVIRRTLKAVNKADRGYIARDTIKYCVDLSGDIFSIFLAALVIDGIAGAKPVDTLLIYAAIVVGVRLCFPWCKDFFSGAVILTASRKPRICRKISGKRS